MCRPHAVPLIFVLSHVTIILNYNPKGRITMTNVRERAETKNEPVRSINEKKQANIKTMVCMVVRNEWMGG